MAIEQHRSGGRGLPTRRPIAGKDLRTAETVDGKPLSGTCFRTQAGGIEAAQRAISASSPSSDVDLVSDLLQLFASWALDLPASEKHHHAWPYGLYRHSLEVASDVVMELQERWSRGGGCSVLTPAEQALWLKVTFALGLLHDCGKLLDVEVRLTASGPCWDPFRESLAGFKNRHGAEAPAPTPHKFRPGRGLTGHERKGMLLLPVILADPKWDLLRPPLVAAFAALTSRHQVPIQGHAVPLAYVADRVHRADVRSARRDWWLGKQRNHVDLVVTAI